MQTISLPEIIGILGFVLSFILFILRVFEYFKSKPKINLEVISSGWKCGDAIENGTGAFYPQGYNHKAEVIEFPKKYAFFKTQFYILNEGNTPIGIKDYYIEWRLPEASYGLDKISKRHSTLLEVKRNKEKNHFILGPGEQKKIEMISYPESHMQILIFEKEIFKHKYKSNPTVNKIEKYIINKLNEEEKEKAIKQKSESIWFAERLPFNKKWKLDLVVVDQRNKRHVLSVFDYNPK